MKKRVLVIYARYGSGHKSIAEYVANYIRDYNNYEVLLLDITPYGNFVGRVGIKFFEYVTKRRAERVFDFFYELMDHRVSTLMHNVMAKKSYDNDYLEKRIKDFNPDVTISTHFYGSNIISYCNDLGIIKSKLYTIITDYRVHECWIRNYDKEDGYIVGNELVKEELIERKVPSKKIYPFGLPLNISSIEKLDDDLDIIKRYGLSLEKEKYLFFGGSTAGSMYYFDYFKMICKLKLDKEIIFICGKNEKLKRKCEEYIDEKDIINVKVLGYSNDVFNLMKISSLVISKPGGATVTECLEMHKPMVLVPGLGGQEKYNARFISRKKYGIKVDNILKFKKWMKKIENNPNIIKNINERMNRINHNKSIEKINDLVKKA